MQLTPQSGHQLPPEGQAELGAGQLHAVLVWTNRGGVVQVELHPGLLQSASNGQFAFQRPDRALEEAGQETGEQAGQPGGAGVNRRGALDLHLYMKDLQVLSGQAQYPLQEAAEVQIPLGLVGWAEGLQIVDQVVDPGHALLAFVDQLVELVQSLGPVGLALVCLELSRVAVQQGQIDAVGQQRLFETVGIAGHQEAASGQAGHKRGEHRRDGELTGSEHQLELTGPDGLVNQRGQTGDKEEGYQQAHRALAPQRVDHLIQSSLPQGAREGST